MPGRMTNLRDVRNPFEFGRELSESELVDREQELDLVERAIEVLPHGPSALREDVHSQRGRTPRVGARGGRAALRRRSV